MTPCDGGEGVGPNRFAPPLTCSVQPAGNLIDLTPFVLIVDHFAVMEEKPEVKSEELNPKEEKSQDDVTGEQKTPPQLDKRPVS